MKKRKIIDEKQDEKPPEKADVKKTYTFKFYMLVLSAAVAIIGLALFVIYIFTYNMAVGSLGFLMIAAGAFAFRYYWQKESSISVEHIGGVNRDTYNSLNISDGRVEFANVYEPKGFPMTCLNDKKKYFVNIDLGKTLTPFVLPDQQYCDTIVFAQRVLGLPAHRKIFERKPKLLQKLKTAFLVMAIGIMWLLILTTTGAN